MEHGPNNPVPYSLRIVIYSFIDATIFDIEGEESNQKKLSKL